MNLLRPTIIAFSRGFSKRDPKLLTTLLIAAVIVAIGIYFGLYKFLDHVSRAPMLGPFLGPVVGGLLLSKLLEMIFLALFFMIVFSSIIAAFSVFYLDEEIRLLMATPVRITRIFWSRFALMVAESSWMALVFFIPIFYAFITAVDAPMTAYLVFPFLIALYLLTPNIIGALLALILGRMFPVRQMRKVFQFLSVLVLASMVFFFRYLEPEKLLNPNHFGSVSAYILTLRNPFLEQFPSSWMRAASLALFSGNYVEAGRALLPLIGMVAAGLLLLLLVARFSYRRSWQASLEAVENQVLSLEVVRRLLVWPLQFCRRDFRVVAAKEVTLFFRDPAIFSQLFMMAAIIFVYGYNLRILPIKDLPSLYSGEIYDSLVFFNGPFIGFIVSAISMRFVYPSVSLEGRAFWAVKASPIKPSRLLMIKFFLYLIPNLLLSLILCTVSNSLFETTSPVLRFLSYLNVILMALVTTALAIGVGAVFAQFNSDNPLKIAGSFGGAVFMVASSLYIFNLLVVESYPMYRFYFRKFMPLYDRQGWVFISISFLLLLLCTLAWVLVPLARGREALERYEPE